MKGRRPETIAKRERENALKERRERKQAKKDQRRLGEPELGEPGADPGATELQLPPE